VFPHIYRLDHTLFAIVDDQLRRNEIHAPTVGILLCTGKNGSTVHYALASTSAPTAVEAKT